VGDAGNVSIVGTPAVAITGATNATPIVITAPGHNFVNGKNVVIDGVLGNTAANGSFLVASSNTGAGTFALTKVIDGSNVAGTGAYTSGGNAQVVDQIVISSTARPVLVQKSGSINLNGMKLASSTSQLIVVQDGGFLGTGRNSYGNPGSGIGSIFITRSGRCIQTPSYSISGSPGNSIGAFFVQASHGGNWRQQSGIGYATANISFDTSLNSAIFFVDNGEIVTTVSPGGVPLSANGFTVVGRNWYIVENGIIQVEGTSPPSDSLMFGSVNGQFASLPTGGITYASLPAAAATHLFLAGGGRLRTSGAGSATFATSNFWDRMLSQAETPIAYFAEIEPWVLTDRS
jgi:hypothetical protein